MNWLWQSLCHATVMLWETFWALVFGFSLSAFLQGSSAKSKSYGVQGSLYITGILFVSLASAGIIVDLLFATVGLVPGVHPPDILIEIPFQWNYTTLLNFAAILLSEWFVWIHFSKNSRRS